MTRKKSPKKKHVLKLKPSLPDFSQESIELPRTRMKVVGIGGGGSNIVAELSRLLSKVEFVAANTDTQALRALPRSTKTIPFGQSLTKGLGCGMNPGLGARAAQIDKERIKMIFEDVDLSILIATLGGGTGSGASPVFAELARTEKNLTLGIFTTPFSFEGEKRMQLALTSLERLKPLLNSYIVIPNNAIFQIIKKELPLKSVLSAMNKIIAQNLRGFLEALSLPGLINIDFADVRAILQGRGRLSYLSVVHTSGPDRAKIALDQLLNNPLYQYKSQGADRIIFNVSGGRDLKMSEVSQVSSVIGAQNPKAKIIFGISSYPKFQNKLGITLFAIGCKESAGFLPIKKKPKPKRFSRARRVIEKRKLKRHRSWGAKKEKVKQKKKARVKHKRKPRLRKKQMTLFLPDHTERRNALDVRKAVDQAIEELQEKEAQWDTPAFLRFKS